MGMLASRAEAAALPNTNADRPPGDPSTRYSRPSAVTRRRYEFPTMKRGGTVSNASSPRSRLKAGNRLLQYTMPGHSVTMPPRGTLPPTRKQPLPADGMIDFLSNSEWLLACVRGCVTLYIVFESASAGPPVKCTR